MSTFAENWTTFLRPVEELNFSLKNSPFSLLTRNNNHCPGKNLYVEKNDLKMTKSRIFGYGILTTSGKSHFPTINNENNYNKVHTAKNYIKNRVYCSAHFIFKTFMIDAINYWILLKNYTFFLDNYFCIGIMMGMVRQDFYSFFLEVLGHARRIEKLTHQPKELVNQNGDIDEWKRRGIFLIIFNTPVCWWIWPKSIIHNWCKRRK